MPAFFARPIVRASALTAVLVLLVHGPVLAGGFQSDDFPLVEITRLRGPLGFWTSGEMFFRPLISVTFWLDLQLYGLAAAGFHASNLIVHAAVTVCVGWIAMRIAAPAQGASTGADVAQSMGAPRDARRSSLPVHATSPVLWLAGAALFAVLPSHAEPVDWIAARTDLWAALGGASSIVAFMHARTHQRAGARRVLFAASLAAFALGLLAKESIVLLPGLVWLIDVAHFRAPVGRALVRAAGHGLLALAYFALRASMIGDWVGGYGAAVHLGLASVGWNLLYYPVRILTGPLRSGAFAALSVGIALAATIAVVTTLRRGGGHAARPLFALACGYVLAAAPVLSLAVDRRTMEGERFLYWPSAVVCVAVVVAAARALHHGRGRIAWCVLVVVCATNSFEGAEMQAAAGRLAEQQASTAAALPDEGRILVGPLLDQRGGAYVFRNGFESAVRLHAPGGMRASMPIAPVRWHPRILDDAPGLRFVAGGRAIEVTAVDGWLSVVEHSGASVDVDSQSPHRVVFGLREAGPADLVVIFEGDLVRQCRPTVDCPR